MHARSGIVQRGVRVGTTAFALPRPNTNWDVIKSLRNDDVPGNGHGWCVRVAAPSLAPVQSLPEATRNIDLADGGGGAGIHGRTHRTMWGASERHAAHVHSGGGSNHLTGVGVHTLSYVA